MTKRRQLAILIIVCLAFSIMAVHQIVCANRGTVLRPLNMAISVILLVMILGGCLWSLSWRNYVGWKQVLFLVAAVSFVILIRYLMLKPGIAVRFSFREHMALTALYILLQLLLGFGFIISVRPRKQEGQSSIKEG
jgi:uncharacterized membrane protein